MSLNAWLNQELNLGGDTSSLHRVDFFFPNEALPVSLRPQFMILFAEMPL